jgi:hypothetical protein
MSNDLMHVRSALARAVAEYRVADDIIDTMAKQLAATKHQIRSIDVCMYGICLDYFIDGEDWWRTIPELIEVEEAQMRGIEVFPWGIPFPDIFRVRVTQSLDAMPQVQR